MRPKVTSKNLNFGTQLYKNFKKLEIEFCLIDNFERQDHNHNFTKKETKLADFTYIYFTIFNIKISIYESKYLLPSYHYNLHFFGFFFAKTIPKIYYLYAYRLYNLKFTSIQIILCMRKE